MFAYAKRNAAMVTSIGAMLVSIMLIIFFGAWAVSASSEGDLSGVLTGATVGFSGSVSPQATQSAELVPTGDSVNVPRLTTSAATGNAAVDTWWGKALLGACPLH